VIPWLLLTQLSLYACLQNCPVCHTEVALTKGGDKSGASAKEG
jgi:hypothetical protein